MIPIAFVGIAARRVANSDTSSCHVSIGIFRVASPIAIAFSADTFSPKIASSVAFARPTNCDR